MEVADGEDILRNCSICGGGVGWDSDPMAYHTICEDHGTLQNIGSSLTNTWLAQTWFGRPSRRILISNRRKRRSTEWICYWINKKRRNWLFCRWDKCTWFLLEDKVIFVREVKQNKTRIATNLKGNSKCCFPIVRWPRMMTQVLHRLIQILFAFF